MMIFGRTMKYLQRKKNYAPIETRNILMHGGLLGLKSFISSPIDFLEFNCLFS
jgi:hypothetical protein